MAAHDTPQARDSFRQASTAFVALVRQVPHDRWSAPGLGDWDLRALVGHAGRACTTIATYLSQPVSEPAQLADAAAYVLAAAELGRTGDLHDVVRRRGIEAGAALGAEPLATVADWADQAHRALAGAEDDPVLATPIGRMHLSAYLPTRTFELTVHGLDLATAIEQPADWPAAPLREALSLMAEVAVRSGRGAAVLHATTGRGSLPTGFSVLG